MIWFLVIGWVFSFLAPWWLLGWRWIQAGRVLAGFGLVIGTAFLWLVYLVLYFFLPLRWPVALAVHFLVQGVLSFGAWVLFRRTVEPTAPIIRRPAFPPSWAKSALALGFLWYLLVLFGLACGGFLLVPGGLLRMLKPSFPQWLFFCSLAGVLLGIALGTYGAWRGRLITPVHLFWSILGFIVLNFIMGLPWLAHGILLFVLKGGGLQEMYGDPRWTVASDFLTSLFPIGQGGIGVVWLALSPSLRSFWRRSLALLLISGFAYTHVMCLRNGQVGLAVALADRLTETDASIGRRNWASRLYRVAWNRCPESGEAGRIALRLAELSYRQGATKEAVLWYRRISQRYQNQVRHRYAVEQADEYLRALASPPSGRMPSVGLSLPVVRHETYTDASWLACLSVIWFWEPSIDESILKLRLQAVSTEEERIVLPPMVRPVDLRRVTPSLGYTPLFLRGTLKDLTQWLAGGIPVLVPVAENYCTNCADHLNFLAPNWSFLLPMVAWDADREAVGLLNYGPLAMGKPAPPLTRQQVDELLKVPERLRPLSKEKEEASRQALITYLPRRVFEEIWMAEGQIYVLLLPREKVEEVLAVTGMDRALAEQETSWITQFSLGAALYHRGYLLPALEAFMEAWEASGGERLPAWYIGLTALWLDDYTERLGRDRFPPPGIRAWSLMKEEADIAPVLEAGNLSLKEGLETGNLHGVVLSEYANILATRGTERESILKAWELLRDRYPVSVVVHDFLAQLYEAEDDPHQQVASLRVLRQLRPDDSWIYLRLASVLLDLGQAGEAARILKGMPVGLNDPSQWEWSRRTFAFFSAYTWDQPLYHEVMGRILNARGKFSAASRYLRLATLGDQASARAHLAYGQALEALGRKLDAAREFRWAMVCDTEGRLGEEARQRLESLRIAR